MLACEENQKLHQQNLEKYHDFGNIDTVPQLQEKSFHQDFSGNLADTPFGGNFYGGETMEDAYGMEKDLNNFHSIDYYRLRTLSRQLVITNMYAAMIEGRLNTNIINAGLKLEANPAASVTGFDDESHVEWTSNVEELWDLWSSDNSVDIQEVHSLAALEEIAFGEAFIEGDILKVVKFNKKTNLPQVKLISGRHVKTAHNSRDLAVNNNRVVQGVEIDAEGRHVAFHVSNQQDIDIGFATDFDAVRIPVKGRTSNREVGIFFLLPTHLMYRTLFLILIF